MFSNTTKCWFGIKEIKPYGLNLFSSVDKTSNHPNKISIKYRFFHCTFLWRRGNKSIIIKLRCSEWPSKIIRLISIGSLNIILLLCTMPFSKNKNELDFFFWCMHADLNLTKNYLTICHWSNSRMPIQTWQQIHM